MESIVEKLVRLVKKDIVQRVGEKYIYNSSFKMNRIY